MTDSEIANETLDLSRRLDRVENAVAQIARSRAISTLERVLTQARAMNSHIQRLALAFFESDPDSPVLKRRVPSVCKSMSSPAEAHQFLTRAVAALRSGGDAALQRFALAERAAGRLE